MKAARERREDFYDPVGRAPQRPNCGTGQSFDVRGELVSMLTIGSRPFVELVLNGLWARGIRYGAKDVGQTIVGRCLDPWDSVRLRTASTHWNVPKK